MIKHQKPRVKKRNPRTATDLVIAKNPKNPYPVYQMLLKV